MKKKYFKRIIIYFIIFVIFAGVSIAYSSVEQCWIQIKETDISSGKLPNSFNGFKIVFVSDIHHCENYPIERVRDVVVRVNAQKPDMVLLGGDYVTGCSKWIEPCFKELKNIKAPYGVYGVLGNNDYNFWEKTGKLVLQSMKKAGITDLNNRGVWINKDNERIRICGVGDFLEGTQDINSAIGNAGIDDYKILLSHNPDYVESLGNRKFDLIMCGHTHGGIITLFGLWAPFTNSMYGQKYRTGLVSTEHGEVLVSNGLGNLEYIKARFFARPQINVVYLKRK